MRVEEFDLQGECKTLCLVGIVNEKTVICFYTLFRILMQNNCTPKSVAVDFHHFLYQPNWHKTIHLHENILQWKQFLLHWVFNEPNAPKVYIIGFCPPIYHKQYLLIKEFLLPVEYWAICVNFQESVNLSLSNLLTYPWIEERVRKGELSIHGGYYDFVDCTFEKWSIDYQASGAFSLRNREFWSWVYCTFFPVVLVAAAAVVTPLVLVYSLALCNKSVSSLSELVFLLFN